MKEALSVFKPKLRPGAKLVVPWGDKGAAGYDSETGESFACPPFPPPEGLVDSLGAGDSFNAALIGSLAHGASLNRDLLNFDEVNSIIPFQKLRDCRILALSDHEEKLKQRQEPLRAMLINLHPWSE